MFKKITHFTLFVSNQDAALKFYTEKLDFIVHTDAIFQEGFRWLTLCLPGQPDVEVALMPATTDQEKAVVGKQGAGKPLFSLESTDCAADFARLKEQGVTIAQEPKSEPWGVSMALQDVDGNVIYVCQPTR